MAESLNLQLKAKYIIISPSHEELEIVIKQLFMRQESEESKQAHALYAFFVSDFPNCLTQKLLKLYQSSSNGVIRFQSIYQLSETFADFRTRRFKLSLDALNEVKPLLISCLTMQETKESDVKILRRIVSFVAYNVMTLYESKWDELSDCIYLLANQEILKGFHIFIDLPPVYKGFLDRFTQILWQKASDMFLDPELHRSRVEDWSLALQTLFKMWIQLLNKDIITFEEITKLMGTQLFNILQSAKKLVEKGKEEFLVRGLEDFERFFSREMNLYDYNEDQCGFVSALVSKMEGVGTEKSKKIVDKIKLLVTNQTIKPVDDVLKNHRAEFGRDWCNHLGNLSSLEILRIFALSDLEDTSREFAIRRLNLLLSDHTLEKVLIKVSEMRELQPLLITCLKEEGISYSMFQVLGQVVNHVAYEIMYTQEDSWDELSDYIASKSETEFQKAAYLFQCLTLPIIDDEFVIDVLEKLLPEINTKLSPPKELLVDNSVWVLAFTSAFCAAISLIDIKGYADIVKEIAEMMIDTVKELVERRMEVGLVRRAFRDMEKIVKEQWDWYGKSEYKFLKGLLWKLYVINGMKWESKIVLWRINVILERGLDEDVKQLPKNESDWVNKP